MKRILISEEEKSRILNLHKKAILVENPVASTAATATPAATTQTAATPATPATPAATGGPLTGQLLSRVDGTFKWGDTIQFKFNGVKNSGQGPITINRFMGSSDNMTSDIKIPTTLAAGATLEPFTVNVVLQKGGTTTTPAADGKVYYDVPFYLFTDGKKQRYQFYCRGTLVITD